MVYFLISLGSKMDKSIDEIIQELEDWDKGLISYFDLDCEDGSEEDFPKSTPEEIARTLEICKMISENIKRLRQTKINP